jgi:hypothetical protein
MSAPARLVAIVDASTRREERSAVIAQMVATGTTTYLVKNNEPVDQALSRQFLY